VRKLSSIVNYKIGCEMLTIWQLAVDPNYGVDEFLSLYAFQYVADVDQIRRGFEEAERLVS